MLRISILTQTYIETIYQLVLSDSDKAKIIDGTARELLKLA